METMIFKIKKHLKGHFVKFTPKMNIFMPENGSP